MANDDTVAIISDLQAQIDDLKRELTLLQGAPKTPIDQPESPAGDVTANRRHLLKLAGAAAVGTVASVAVAGRAAAEIGYVTTGGSQIVGDAVNQRQDTSRPGKTAFVFQTAGGQTTNDSLYPGALGGWTFDAEAPNGVYGYSSVSNGRGVVGYGQGGGSTGVYGASLGTAGIGVTGDGPGNGVRGTSSAADGKGVFGQATLAGGVGVQGTGVSTGVAGYGGSETDAIGVYGSGTGPGARGGGFVGSGAGAIGVIVQGVGTNSSGVDASGEAYGVKALATGPASTGVDAVGSSHGVWGRSSADFGVGVRGLGSGLSAMGIYGVGTRWGVYGQSTETSGLGGAFSGFNGAVLIGSDQATAPAIRARMYERGVIEADTNGNIWYCYEAGTPGKWVKLAGPGTAGTFHPLSPGRVCDSREPQPSPGAIAGGGNRTISVADRRAVAGGAVAQTNFVPAGATAVAANITIVTQSGAGFLAANPGGVTEISASTINWSEPGQILANGVILTLNANREITIVAGGGSTHFLIDLTGYWL